MASISQMCFQKFQLGLCCKGKHRKVSDQNGVKCNWKPYLQRAQHESQVSESGEAGLHTHLKNCKKNPGHLEFIPIGSFSLEHLPEGCRDSDLYDLVKAVADLTARLSINMTSPGRPEFWPNTDVPYFLSELRGKEKYRTGTGRVVSVSKTTDKDRQCHCDDCKSSDKPSKVLWDIKVATASHVVFDDFEASHTTLRMFYDREDSPLVLLKAKALVPYVDVEEDWCLFICVTCDENLANKLKQMYEHFKDVWFKVLEKFSESRDIVKQNFIVSHPHGCSKQVSVGPWLEKLNVMELDHNHKFIYTTCTCPGSSGAHVYCVGYDIGGWSSDLVHSGSLTDGPNYSGIGYALQLLF